MTGHAAVGVNDDLAASEPSVANGAADDKPAGRVDIDVVVIVGELLGDHGTDDVFDQVRADHRVAINSVVVLSRDQHGLELDRSIVLVLERHLRLGVGPKIRNLACLADLGVLLRHAVRKVDRQRHEDLGLVAGVAEHHALVACALRVELVLLGLTRSDLFRGRDALRDVGRLLIEGDHDAAGVAVVPERLPVVADHIDRAPDRAWDIDIGLGSDLTGHDGNAGGDKGLAGDPTHGVLGQHLVENGVGNLVRHLVGMALRHAL